MAEYLDALPISNYAIGDAGLVPFLTLEKKVYDYYGLNSRAFTTPPIENDLDKYIKWLSGENPDAVVIVSKKNSVFIPKNETQRHIVRTFSEERGYVDSGRSFGSEGDKFHYRILIRKKSLPGK